VTSDCRLWRLRDPVAGLPPRPIQPAAYRHGDDQSATDCKDVPGAHSCRGDASEALGPSVVAGLRFAICALRLAARALRSASSMATRLHEAIKHTRPAPIGLLHSSSGWHCTLVRSPPVYPRPASTTHRVRERSPAGGLRSRAVPGDAACLTITSAAPGVRPARNPRPALSVSKVLMSRRSIDACDRVCRRSQTRYLGTASRRARR